MPQFRRSGAISRFTPSNQPFSPNFVHRSLRHGVHGGLRPPLAVAQNRVSLIRFCTDTPH